jgi:hypothetical protein
VKRDPALVTLSHDHHLALSAAQTLKRATADTASVARAAFVAYWEEHGRGHFRLEEEILLRRTHRTAIRTTRSSRERCATMSTSARVPTRSP